MGYSLFFFFIKVLRLQQNLERFQAFKDLTTEMDPVVLLTYLITFFLFRLDLISDFKNSPKCLSLPKLSKINSYEIREVELSIFDEHVIWYKCKLGVTLLLVPSTLSSARRVEQLRESYAKLHDSHGAYVAENADFS